MRALQSAVLAALLRVRAFIGDNLAALMNAADLSVVRQRLDLVIASFTAHAVDQDAHNRSAKAETETQRQLQVKLRTQQMHPIAEIARHDLRTVPQFKELQLPPRSAKGPTFLASAKAMVNAAEVNKAALLARGLPADTLDQFQASLLKLEESLGNRERYRTRRMGATKGLSEEEKEGRSVLNVLDALVRRALEGNEPLLRTWEGARTIKRRPAGVTPASSAAAPATSTEPQGTSPSGPVVPAA